MMFNFLIIGFFLSYTSSASANFGYEGLNGPQHWGEDYNSCVGKHQSPINIVEHVVKNVSLQNLVLAGIETPRQAYIENNGHTVLLKINDSDRPTISGGPLGNHEYVFEQLHFHWGENDHEGSEDMINNHSFAVELHVVFYKRDYGSFGKAIDHPDGLTVLAYFFEASEDDNPTYDIITHSLPEIEAVDSSTTLSHPLIFHSLLQPNKETLQDYFTYNGSLTTPPCSEVVTWIDFKEPLVLSHHQIAAFRNLRSPDGVKLTHNFRPIQPLEDRIVFHNMPLLEEHSENHHHHHHHEGNGEPELKFSLPITIGAVILPLAPEILSIFFSLIGDSR